MCQDEKSCEDGADGPGGVPCVRMVVRDGQTEPGVCLEPSIGAGHVDGRGFERKLRGEN